MPLNISFLFLYLLYFPFCDIFLFLKKYKIFFRIFMLQKPEKQIFLKHQHIYNNTDENFENCNNKTNSKNIIKDRRNAKNSYIAKRITLI